MKNEIVAILLATYNGEKYLENQIESIINQTYTYWKLYICDDGSKDSTLDIINSYCEKYPDKIQSIQYPTILDNGAKNNFFRLLAFAKENLDNKYYMFADQDDVWLPDKILLCVEYMSKVQHNYPILIHTDLIVVDSNLNITEKSFIKMRSLNPNIKDLSNLLIQNNITGCTMMFNSKLLDVLKFNNLDMKNIILHDWWLALVASAFGEIHFLNIGTILYRQHGNNVIGAKKINSINYIINCTKHLKQIQKILKESFKQAECFYKIYEKNLSEGSGKIVRDFIEISNKSKIFMIISLIKGGYLKQGIIPKIGQIFAILFLKLS